MILYIGITLYALVLSYFCRKTADGYDHRQRVLNAWVCMGIYVVLGAVAFCRIANSNDYWEYVDMFSLIAQKRPVSSEWGFNCFVRLIQWLCGLEKFGYVMIFGLISLLTLFFFLRAIYRQSDWFLAGLFLFLTNGYYFSSFNSIRYYLALSIVVFAMESVILGQYVRFFVCVLLAATFHKSVLIVLPVYLLAKWLSGRRLRWYQVVVCVLFLGSLVFGRDLYRKVLFLFYRYYENSMFDTVRYSYTNIAKCLGTCLICGISYRFLRQDRKNRFYMWLTLIGLVTYTFGAFIPEVSRIGYYFTISQMFLLPNLLSRMQKGWCKTTLIACTTVAFVVHFLIFLRNAYATDIRLLPYRTWIFQ